MIDLFFSLASAVLGIALFATILFAGDEAESGSTAGNHDAGGEGSLVATSGLSLRDTASFADFASASAKLRRAGNDVSRSARPQRHPASAQMAAQISTSGSPRGQMSGCL